MENWLRSEGTLLYNKFRLRLTQNCSLRIESFSEEECGGDQDILDKNRADINGGRDLKDSGMLLGSTTCYRFQSCGDTDGKDNNIEGSGDSHIY